MMLTTGKCIHNLVTNWEMKKKNTKEIKRCIDDQVMRTDLLP